MDEKPTYAEDKEEINFSVPAVIGSDEEEKPSPMETPSGEDGKEYLTKSSEKTEKVIKVAIASTNPTKVGACRSVFERALGSVEVISIDSISGVSDQPMSEAESVEGAINRARGALRRAEADYGVGMEGCIYETSKGYFLTGWCAVIDKNGSLGLGSGGHIELPFAAVDKILLEGKELGYAMDEITGEKDVKKRMGTIGILTKNYDGREKAWEVALLYALARVINPDIYAVQPV